MGLLKREKHSVHHSKPVHVAPPAPVHVAPPEPKPIVKPPTTPIDDKLQKAMNGETVTTLETTDTTTEANTTSTGAQLLHSKSTATSSNIPTSTSAYEKEVTIVNKDAKSDASITVSDAESLKNPNTDAQLLDSSCTAVSNNVPAPVSNSVALPHPLPVVSNNDNSSLNEMETKKSRENIKNHIKHNEKTAKHDEKKGKKIAKKQTSKSALNADLATSKAILNRAKNEFPTGGEMNELTNSGGDNHNSNSNSNSNTNSSGVAVSNNVVVAQQTPPDDDDSSSDYYSILLYFLAAFVLVIIIGAIIYGIMQHSKKPKTNNNNTI